MLSAFYVCCIYSDALQNTHARIQEFFSGEEGGGGGGGGGQYRSNDQKNSSTYFTVYRGGPMILLQRKLYFSKDPEGVQHFQGGFQMLISIETHLTCDFPGGGGGGGGGGTDPLSPLLDLHMILLQWK